MSRVDRPRVSYTDLQHQPEDGRRYEIYDGEVFVVPSPLPLHQVVAGNIAEVLRRYSAARGGLAISAPLDIVFSEYDILQPAVVFFSAARRHLIDLRAPIRSGPDLVVEVLSPSTASTDRGRKLQTFARFGVPEYWIVDPDVRTIEVLRLESGTFVLAAKATGTEKIASPVLVGLVLAPDAIIPAM